MAQNLSKHLDSERMGTAKLQIDKQTHGKCFYTMRN